MHAKVQDTTREARPAIGHVVVVAGAPASGKTTLIRRCRAGELAQLCGQLGIPPGASCAAVNANALDQLDGLQAEVLYVHYDLVAGRAEDGAHPRCRDIARITDTLSVVVLAVPAPVLSRRLRWRLARRLGTALLKPWGAGARGLPRHVRKLRDTSGRPQLCGLYREWDRAQAELDPGRALWVDTSIRRLRSSPYDFEALARLF